MNLTPAERARRAAALGITMPPPRAATPANGHKPPPEKRPILTLKKPVMLKAPAVDPPPAEKAPTKAERQAAVFERFKATQRLVSARYPMIFSWGRPLAVGIRERLREAFTEDELGDGDLRAFLKWWCRRPAYRAALERGDRRVNLDGSDAGPAFDDEPILER